MPGRADEALAALAARVRTDTALVAALGGPRVYRAGEKRAPEVPSVEYRVVFGRLDEAFEPVLTQWDVFAWDQDTMQTVVERLRRLLHWVGWRTINGVALNSRYEEMRDHDSQESGIIHRSIDFRHEPVRRRGW